MDASRFGEELDKAQYKWNIWTRVLVPPWKPRDIDLLNVSTPQFLHELLSILAGVIYAHMRMVF